MKTIGVVLAGGDSRRYGSNKLLEPVAGRAMISHVLDVLSGSVDEVFVSVGSQHAELGAATGDVDIIVDEIPDRGPIGGLYSAFRATRADWIVLVAGDMPYMTDTSIESILKARTDYANAVVAIDSGGKPHPLAACYSRSVLPVVESCIDDQLYAMKTLLSRIDNVEYITLPGADLTNVNRPGDLSEMRGTTPADR